LSLAVGGPEKCSASHHNFRNNKETLVKITKIAVILFLGAAISTAAFPQPAAGPGIGPGGGKGMNFDQSNTRGWDLMSVEERATHRDKMRAVKTYEECKAVQVEHHTSMEARAKEKGVSLPTVRQNGCERMKARGIIK
jgi:Spy/CpxP family protein refolding chaperone